MSQTLEFLEREQKVIAPNITPVDSVSTMSHREIEGASRSGRAWGRKLHSDHHKISPEAQEILEGNHFSNFPGNQCNLVIIRVVELVSQLPADYSDLFSAAAHHGYILPHVEAGPICRERFTAEDLRRLGCLCALVPHQPIKGKVLSIRIPDNFNKFDLDTAPLPICSPLTAVVLWDPFGNGSID